jgi:hypothetical protein
VHGFQYTGAVEFCSTSKFLAAYKAERNHSGVAKGYRKGGTDLLSAVFLMVAIKSRPSFVVVSGVSP